MMFLSSIRVQIRVAFRRREFQIAFAIACAYACFAFIYTLLEFRNTDISLIKDANQSVCFSQFNELWFFFSLIYPFLIVLPCATSFVEDYRNRLLPAYISRTSKSIYYLSKLFACLFSTALVFFIPFLMNIVLCNAFLPHNGNTWFGEYQMDNYCQQLLGTNIIYRTGHSGLILLKVFLTSPLLYSVCFLIIFSLFSGILAASILGISLIFKKSIIVLFVPLFVLIRGLDVYDAYLFSQAVDTGKLYTNYRILDYVTPTNTSGQSPTAMGFFMVITVAIICCTTAYAIRSDADAI